METIRAFLAVPTPEDAARAIRALVDRLKPALSGARFVPVTQWHLTLHFFAALTPDQVEGVRQAAKDSASGLDPFPVSLCKLGTFPDPRRPRVLWLGLAEGARECTALRDRLARELRARGLPVEDRPFRPHLTLARFWDPPPGGIDGVLRRAPSEEVVRFTAGNVVLFRSILTPRGAEHARLDAFTLGAGGPGRERGGT